MLSGHDGFTLLETMIAITIMVISFAAILTIQSSSIEATAKAKEMTVIAMLARNAINEAELEIKGKTFTELKKEENGNFDEPFEEYTWVKKIEEVKFPDFVSLATGGGSDSSPAGDAGKSSEAGVLGKIITNYLTKGVRKITITITGIRNKTQTYTVSTYWVNMSGDIQLSP